MKTFKIYGHGDDCDKKEDGALCYYSDVEPILNSLQQIKAEIAKICDEHDDAFSQHLIGAECCSLFNRLRQLSAA